MTPEEKANFDFRLGQLESRLAPSFEALKTRVMSYDKVVDELKQIREVQSELCANHSYLEEKLGSFSLGIQLLNSESNQAHEGLSSSIQSHAKELLDLKNSNRTISANVSNQIEALKLQFEASVNDLQSKIVGKPDKANIDFAYNILKVMINDLTSKLESHKSELDAFKSRVGAELSAIVDTSVSMSKHTKDHQVSLDAAEDLRRQITGLRESSVVNLAVLKDKMIVSVQEMKNSFSNLPEPNESLRSEFDKKLESAILDSKNATVRTQNSDQKITLLEKKIESINLLLKKYELNL
jgi:hypothetical protein